MIAQQEEEVPYGGTNPTTATHGIAEIDNARLRQLSKMNLTCFWTPDDSKIVTLDLDHGFKDWPELSIYGVREVLFTKSKTAHHQHGYMLLANTPAPAVRSALAVACGSDPKRELLSAQRMAIGGRYAYALFETPESAQLVRDWIAHWDLREADILELSNCEHVAEQPAQGEIDEFTPF